jgi:hypothetical protein
VHLFCQVGEESRKLWKQSTRWLISHYLNHEPLNLQKYKNKTCFIFYLCFLGWFIIASRLDLLHLCMLEYPNSEASVHLAFSYPYITYSLISFLSHISLADLYPNVCNICSLCPWNSNVHILFPVALWTHTSVELKGIC